MSRIYEALQRADMERKTGLVLDDDQLLAREAVPEMVPEFEDPLSATPATTAVVDKPAVPAPGPMLAITDIPHYAWKPSAKSLPTLEDRGAGVEQFRSLRSRIYQARYEAPVKTILVCSGMPAEGKSFVTANLAMSLARNSVNSILLIDADLRRPTQHELLGAPNEIGLTDYLSGTAELKDIMQRDSTVRQVVGPSIGSVSNLTFIPAGTGGDNSSELVANHRIEQLIAEASPHFDWILIDSPPVLAVADAVELSHAADAVLLIARGGRTPYEVAQKTQAAFIKSRILGFVLNDVKEAPRRGYGYYDYYGGQNDPSKSKG